MTTAEYHAREMQRMLDRGPYPGEDFFQLKVWGDGESRTINITAEELAAIVAVVGKEPA